MVFLKVQSHLVDVGKGEKTHRWPCWSPNWSGKHLILRHYSNIMGATAVGGY